MSVFYSFFLWLQIVKQEYIPFFSLFVQKIRRSYWFLTNWNLEFSDYFLYFLQLSRTQNITLLQQWSKAGKHYMQIYWKLHFITGIFHRIWPQVQNIDFKKYISMAVSEDNYFLRTFLSGSFLKGEREFFHQRNSSCKEVH